MTWRSFEWKPRQKRIRFEIFSNRILFKNKYNRNKKLFTYIKSIEILFSLGFQIKIEINLSTVSIFLLLLLYFNKYLKNKRIKEKYPLTLKGNRSKTRVEICSNVNLDDNVNEWEAILTSWYLCGRMGCRKAVEDAQFLELFSHWRHRRIKKRHRERKN